ncbi:3401_t:CDS:2, partial [Cetraspora pellucida]
MQNDNTDDSDGEEVTNDERNVSKRIKHAMVTLAVLNDQKNILKPENHYTNFLFSGTENYAYLKIALKPIHCELHELYKYSFTECFSNYLIKF